jgi:TRAP-type uncharacterized transport system fused permease subunit
LHGYFLTRAALWQRGVLVAGGLSLVAPALWTDLAGATLAAIAIGAQILGRRAAVKPAQAAE